MHEPAERTTLSSLNGSDWDAVIIGGGICGASAAQHLAAAGYRVLLVEKDDFASGATSRSGRLLHCGLRYLTPARSTWEYLWQPRKFATALRMALTSSRVTDELVLTMPTLTRKMRIMVPIYKDAPFASWQVPFGVAALKLLAGRKLPLNLKRHRNVRSSPFARRLRAVDDIDSIMELDDYQMNWGERICIDAVLDAQRMGADIRNYTVAQDIRRVDDKWSVTISDVHAPDERATVTGTILLNMGGPWIDKINETASGAGGAPRQVVGVKGVNVLVRLPPECRGHGIIAGNRHNEIMSCFPWGDLHFIGATETLYDGSLEDVRPEEEDVSFILDEMNHLFPAMDIKRTDVVQAWAGVRPITYDPDQEKGARLPFNVLRDLSDQGLPNVITITWAAIMLHRHAARKLVDLVRGKLSPSGPQRQISYAARKFPDHAASPKLIDGIGVTLADLVHSAEREHPRKLVDLLYRRTGVGWHASISPDVAALAARTVAATLGWSEEDQQREVSEFIAYAERYHLQSGASWHANLESSR